MLDKIKGGLFGVAIGDALGGTTEFMTESEIKEIYGEVNEIIGGGVWNLTPGEVTDDTDMTLAVARGIIKNYNDPINPIGEEFINWYKKKPKDVGNIISEVLSQYNGDWFTTAKNVHKQLQGKSAGNGTLMRCLPIALSYLDLQDVIRLTKAHSKMTHYDDAAAEVCIIYNKIAFKLLQKEALKQAIETEVKNTIYEKVIFTEPTVPSDGYVINTFLWVLYYLYHFESFTEVAVHAANKGGDSDTIAAIACGLKGIEVGYNNLPSNYKDVIILKNKIATISQQLYDLRSK